MKKKAIENIPYLGLRKVIQKKDVKYVGVTAIKEIQGERHLFIEVYRNEKGQEKIPVVRIVLTKKDFGNYIPEQGEWNYKMCKERDRYSAKMVWERGGERAECWLQGGEDLDRIIKFTKVKPWKVLKAEPWWRYIREAQEEISYQARRKTRERAEQKRRRELRERQENTKELPEDEILNTADKVCFRNEHHLYYKKHGSRARIACSGCGGTTEGKWKRGESYLSQFERRIEEPREGQKGICPICGAAGTYKCQGKATREKERKAFLFLGQRYKEQGMVLRYVEVTKRWYVRQIQGEKGPEMHGAYEALEGAEIARAYIEPGKKTQIDYHKHDPYRGEDFWDDCNLYGMAKIGIRKGYILQSTYEEMKGTAFRYSALEEYARQLVSVNPVEYLKRYQQNPQLEMIVKLGLIKTAEKLVNCEYGIVANAEAKRLDDFLGIRKEHVKLLIEKKGDIKLLEAMKLEHRMGERWTAEQIEKIAEAGLRREQIERATKYMSLQKLLNRIEKYAGNGYGTECSMAESRIRSAAITYTDYLHMRLQRGYDLRNTIYLYPKDLETAHAKMVEETYKTKAEERLKQVNERYAKIRGSYRTLRKKYLYESGGYLIRPAKSAEEIVIEGRTLHHCVGGDNYLSKHNNKESYILMLRRREAEKVPYITVEIDAREPRIRQWFGAYDEKPDKKKMQRWLDGYIAYLNGTKEEAEIKIAIA